MPALDVAHRIGIALPLYCVVLMFLTACNSGEQAAPESPLATKAASSSVVLREFPLPPYAVRLSIGACKESCPVQVELWEQGKLLDTHALPVPVVNSQSYEETVDAYWGADPGLTAWASGEESSYVSTTARTVQLSPAVQGLLVTQHFGFEHIKRANVLLTAKQNQLVPAWQASEAPGPHPTMTLVAPDGKPGFVFIDITDRTSNGSVDLISVLHLFQDAKAAKLTQQTLPRPDFPLYLLHAGTYSNAGEARAARDACLAGLLVLDSGTYRQAPGTAFLGALFTRRAAAEEAQKTIVQCDAKVSLGIDEYTNPPQ